MIPSYDVFIHLGTPRHVIRFDGQHFLQGIGCAVGFQCPHFHFTEALAAELGFAAQGLLRDEAVRAGRAGMHFIVHQMVQFQHVHVAYGYGPVEHFTGAAVSQPGLAIGRQPRQFEHSLDFFFDGAIEHRRGHGHTATEITGHFQDFAVLQRFEVFPLSAVVVDALQQGADFRNTFLPPEHGVDLASQLMSSPAEVNFQDLANVHP